MMSLSAPEVAKAAGVGMPWMRRVLREVRSGKRTYWKGAAIELADEETLTVRFSSLPLDVREAVMMWDQQPLPFDEHIQPEFAK